MKIDIWSDIACPWCYVGKRRFERALERFDGKDSVDVVWHSFQLDPGAPPSREESQTELLASKYGVPHAQAAAMNARMTSEGVKEGLEMDFDRVRVTNTFDAHRLMHLARAHDLQDAMKERLFRAYLTEGALLSDHAVLARLAEEVGIDANEAGDVLASDRHAADVRADEARARSLGISGVPFFVIDEMYGVSGAQSSEVLLQVMREVCANAPRMMARESGEQCDDESCAV